MNSKRLPTAGESTLRGGGLKRFLFRSRLGQLLLALCGIRILGALELVPDALTTASTIGLWTYAIAIVLWGLAGLRRNLLWRIRRKLVISYLLIGLVPTVLILVVFRAHRLLHSRPGELLHAQHRRRWQSRPRWKERARRSLILSRSCTRVRGNSRLEARRQDESGTRSRASKLESSRRERLPEPGKPFTSSTVAAGSSASSPPTTRCDALPSVGTDSTRDGSRAAIKERYRARRSR